MVAGMSGSPVYIEGKLAGALSLKLGTFTKEPLAGVTPIENILSLPTGSPARSTQAGGGPRRGRRLSPANGSAIQMPSDWASRSGLPGEVF